MNDLISRQQALKEMWKALYEYEDKTEKQFQESKYLDVRDWIINDRLWVQNGHNLCVNVLANLPSAQPEIIRCKDCKHYYFAGNRVPEEQSWVCDVWHVNQTAHMGYCFKAERRSDEQQM